ncbi:MAG TPA: SAM-dependent methyltransferase, partial [Candidatus Binatia bacterium]|nr:SAM-dependent methyltransferase [Candidatus Binatia bacterium]
AGQFGKAGDFYTSSDVHAVFGRLLARQFDEMWRVLGSPATIVLRELGPGRGLFAQDVLDWSEKKFPEFFRALRYELVEQSPALRQRIDQTLVRHFQSGKATFAKIDRMNASGASTLAMSTTEESATGKSTTLVVPNLGPPEAALAAAVPVLLFANEFFDAVPVEVVSTKGSLRIDARNGQFVETWAAPSPEELEFLDRYSIHPEEGERSEVPLQAQQIMSDAAHLHRGFTVVVDYGYTREEQLAGRHRGTLKAIRQHSVSANPYEAPGEQDITADVNFTALAAAAERQGMHAHKLVTQSQFLMGIGEANQFADAFEGCRQPQERAKVALQLKHLVTPAGMGESFHVLVASKGINAEQVSRLAGLCFGRR